MRILLTNDDGCRSPLLHFLIEWLREVAELTVVVPAREQSWTGKAMTRFGSLAAARIRIGEQLVHTLDGRPADCTNVALHHLCGTPPDLVVSGINVGANAGIGFLVSSGTVGACLEANIAGVPALALSQSVGLEAYRSWTEDHQIDAAEVARLKAQTFVALGRIWAHVLAAQQGRDRPLTWNVNLPEALAPDWAITPAAVGHTIYGSCFVAGDHGYHHELKSVTLDERDCADGMVIRRGQVSLSCIDIWAIGQG